MKMANLLLRYETTNYANHSPSKYRVNGTKDAENVRAIGVYIFCLFIFLREKKSTLRCCATTMLNATDNKYFTL